MKFGNEANAPPAIVGLVGRKEYEQCAKDLYYFLQVFAYLHIFMSKPFLFHCIDLFVCETATAVSCMHEAVGTGPHRATAVNSVSGTRFCLQTVA